MIHVLATLTIAADQRDAFLAEFRTLVPTVLAEDGCLAYGPAVDLASGHPAQGQPRPDVVVVIEQWRDLATLKAHGASAHMAAYRDRVKGLVIGTQLQVLAPA